MLPFWCDDLESRVSPDATETTITSDIIHFLMIRNVGLLSLSLWHLAGTVPILSCCYNIDIDGQTDKSLSLYNKLPHLV
jgi:hypothetical protein